MICLLICLRKEHVTKTAWRQPSSIKKRFLNRSFRLFFVIQQLHQNKPMVFFHSSSVHCWRNNSIKITFSADLVWRAHPEEKRKRKQLLKWRLNDDSFMQDRDLIRLKNIHYLKMDDRWKLYRWYFVPTKTKNKKIGRLNTGQIKIPKQNCETLANQNFAFHHNLHIKQ